MRKLTLEMVFAIPKRFLEMVFAIERNYRKKRAESSPILSLSGLGDAKAQTEPIKMNGKSRAE